jgi:hypothetical protein
MEDPAGEAAWVVEITLTVIQMGVMAGYLEQGVKVVMAA